MLPGNSLLRWVPLVTREIQRKPPLQTIGPFAHSKSACWCLSSLYTYVARFGFLEQNQNAHRTETGARLRTRPGGVSGECSEDFASNSGVPLLCIDLHALLPAELSTDSVAVQQVKGHSSHRLLVPTSICCVGPGICT